MKRLFIGLPIQIVDLGESFSGDIKKLKIGADRRDMGVKWTPIENYHITLNFIGEVEEKKIEVLIESISQSLQNFSTFTLKIKNMGAFVSVSEARALWVGVQKSFELIDLQKTLHQALMETGYSQDKRDFSPHATIGRLRNHRNVKDLISPFVRKKYGKVNVSEVVLFESVLGGPHSSYKPLKRFVAQSDTLC